MATRSRRSRDADGTTITVTYFSRAGINMVAGRQQQLVVGNTARVVIAIADKLSVATNAIEAVEPYPDSYQLTLARARREADQQTWPPVERTPMRVGKVLLLGFPIWWGDLPRPVATWLRQTQLSGVTIYPFCTHEGSRFGTSLTTIANLCPAATVGLGLPVRGNRVQQADAAVRHWLVDNGLLQSTN